MDETTRPVSTPTSSQAASGPAGAEAHGRVVVGVDGSKESRLALRWACTEALARGATVLALSVWHLYPLAPPEQVGASPWWFTADPGEATRSFLRDVVQEVAADFPDVTIDQQVRSGHAAEQLVELSASADAVVMGATGSGGFVGMRLGSTSRAVLEHALCTVVVAR
jgi:nucleotide-binding universal stress UspA family protein